MDFGDSPSTDLGNDLRNAFGGYLIKGRDP
jgi:hypothetical protein